MPITFRDGVLQEPEFSDYVLNLETKHEELRAHAIELEVRMRELILLMENDIMQGRVTVTKTRKMVLDQSRALVPWVTVQCLST